MFKDRNLCLHQKMIYFFEKLLERKMNIDKTTEQLTIEQFTF